MRPTIEQLLKDCRARWRAGEEAREILESANEILGGSGVEGFVPPGGGEFEYVNLGDTYASTILWDGEGFSIGSWGDFLESAEEEHEQETGETRCPYCGEWGEKPCHLPDGTVPKRDSCKVCGEDLHGNGTCTDNLCEGLQEGDK